MAIDPRAILAGAAAVALVFLAFRSKPTQVVYPQEDWTTDIDSGTTFRQETLNVGVGNGPVMSRSIGTLLFSDIPTGWSRAVLKVFLVDKTPFTRSNLIQVGGVTVAVDARGSVGGISADISDLLTGATLAVEIVPNMADVLPGENYYRYYGSILGPEQAWARLELS